MFTLGEKPAQIEMSPADVNSIFSNVEVRREEKRKREKEGREERERGRRGEEKGRVREQN